jgi:L-Ala-D/L-Glu epimerase
MHITLHTLPLIKRHPLTISRGTSAGSENLLVQVTQDGVTGYGEFAPVSQTEPPENAQTARIALATLAVRLEEVTPFEMQCVEAIARETEIGRAAFCALDAALHDWVGKRLGVPVWRLLGADLRHIVSTSVTIGINPPDVARERTREVLERTGAHGLKIKLGSPAGIEADKEMFAAVQEVTPPGIPLRVDANGGWQTVEAARDMMRWLAVRDVEYIEQPLAMGREDEFPALFAERPLPIFADESCRTAADVPCLAPCVDGINLKLMKAGGIREGLRVIHAARACGLSVMMGCMSESSLSIAASAAISAYADHLDLDSHLNLAPDPFTGLLWTEGRILPSESPGLGVRGRPQSEN